MKKLHIGKNCGGTYTLAWGSVFPTRGFDISLRPFRVRWFDILKYPLGKSRPAN